jgi:aminoglycoside phosphotransferase family enzyme/predicted kinase
MSARAVPVGNPAVDAEATVGGAAPSGQAVPAAAPSASRLVETHTSVLVFLGDRVYKVKKRADLGFLDFRSREARLAACRAEVALNGRLAPDVYLGVADVTGPDGALCDHMVVMRRLPPERRLATLVRAGADVTRELRDVARLVASFHSRCDTSPEIAAAGDVAALRGLWAEGAAGLAPFRGDPLRGETVDEIGRLAGRYLDGREPLLRERQRAGRVRDGHGDLLAEDIFCLDDGPRVLDCLEFDQRLRVGDVLGDVAFLAMDLQRLGRPDLAARFLDAYREFTGETHPRSLEHFYVAYRAFVRCKVACLRHAQGETHGAARARELAEIALSRLRQGRVRLVLVGGLPASGKSTLAAGLAGAEGWTVLRSDVIRKELAGIPADQPAPAALDEGLYTPAATDAVYAELIRRAGVALERGESVILDASWGSRAHRRQAAARARAAAADVIELRCAVAREIAVSRIAARASGQAGGRPQGGTPTDGAGSGAGSGAGVGAGAGRSVSDASVPVLDGMAGRADPWPEATTIFTTGSVGSTLYTARRSTS